ncbi:hypothetical protein SEA_ZOOMAN_301 [Microbacterium phage Zooman]|nr:hypothetical protein SEA_ZOOMAN_301 [Microbacterium phage Zooman]
MGATMGYQPIHLRPYEERRGYTVTLIDSVNDPFVIVEFDTPFVYGNSDPYSTAKLLASQKLKKNYDHIRVIDLVFKDERIHSMYLAYRKPGRK